MGILCGPVDQRMSSSDADNFTNNESGIINLKFVFYSTQPRNSLFSTSNFAVFLQILNNYFAQKKNELTEMIDEMIGRFALK